MENRISLENQSIILENIEWLIQEEIARGSSIIAYKVFNEKYGTAILKEYYPLELEIEREENRLVCEDEEEWEKSKEEFSNKMKRFIHMIRNHLVDKMIYNHLPTTLIYEKEQSINNTIYILQSYSFGSIYSKYKEKTLLELFENILSISKIANDLHEQGYILFDLKPSNLYVVEAIDQHYFNMIDFDSITKKEDINESTLIKCTHDYHDDTPLNEISEKYDIYSLGCMVKERINDHDLSLVHYKVKPLVDELIQKSCCKQEDRYDDNEFINKVLEILEYLQLKYFLTSMTPYPKKIFGYEEELKKIHTYLKKDKYASLYGLKGVGKSTIANEYAYRYQKDYKIIQIVDFKNDWLETFKCFRLNHELESLSYNFIFSLLNQCENSLFIINNYVFNEDNDQILDLLRKTNVHLILTSNYGNIHIKGLDEHNAISLFKEIYGQEIKNNELSSVYKLMNDINYHPGLIELCASTIKQINATFFQSPIKIFMSKIHKDIMIQVDHHFDSFENHLHKLLNLEGFNDNEKECLYLLQFADEIGMSENFVIKYGISYETIHSLIKKYVIQRSNGMIRINSLFNSELIRKCLNLNTYVSEQLFNALNDINEPNFKCSMICRMSTIDPLFNKVLNNVLNPNVLIYASTYHLIKLKYYLNDIKDQISIYINFEQLENEILKRQNKIDDILNKIHSHVHSIQTPITLEKITELKIKAKENAKKGKLYDAIRYYLQANKLLTYFPFGFIDIIENDILISEICYELGTSYQGVFYAKKAYESVLEKDHKNTKLLVRSILNLSISYFGIANIKDSIHTALSALEVENIDDHDLDQILDRIAYNLHIHTISSSKDEKNHYFLYNLTLKIQNIREKIKRKYILSNDKEIEIHLIYATAMHKARKTIEAVDYLSSIEKYFSRNNVHIPKSISEIKCIMIITHFDNYLGNKLTKNEIFDLMNFLERNLNNGNFNILRTLTSGLGQLYAYLIYYYPEFNTMEYKNKANYYIKKYLYYCISANPGLYKKEIEYFTYLLNNLGIEYQPFKVKNEIILNDMEEVLSLAHIVNNKLDEIMKLY